jgi:hypothetical protein
MKRVAILFAVLVACSSSPASRDASESTAAEATTAPSGGTSTAADSSSTSTSSADSSGSGSPQCSALYGRPNENTGLSADQCGPACPCLEDWQAPEYTAADIDALEALQLTTAFDLLDADPYETPEDFPLEETSVCAVMVEGSEYSVQTFADDAAAEAAGAAVTHDGACGLCSPLQDLAVYMRQGDLTEPVRACGLMGLSGGEEAQLECLRELGFTEPCAQIWGYNTTHTRTMCLQVCLDLLDAPYHEPDGSLNACLQCDEELSGPVFKAVAGRTRRNTGLASALCRPCDEVRRVVHRYD